jgi:hypothetical protein
VFEHERIVSTTEVTKEGMNNATCRFGDYHLTWLPCKEGLQLFFVRSVPSWVRRCATFPSLLLYS